MENMTHKPDAVDAEQTDFDALLREVVKDEILKDARPTLESLKALHADRPLLVLALSQAIESLTELDALRREVEAGKQYKNLACKTDRFEGVAADGTAWSITWRDDRWYWINREVVSVMDDPIEALELLAALEGESR